MDSFCNMIMTYTVLSSLGVNIEGENFKARFQGDDAIISFPENKFASYRKHFLTLMADKAMYYFNAKLSADKSMIGDHPNALYALGYHNRYGVPTRTDEDLLGHLFFPERPQDFGRLAASALGLAHASLGCSRTFYDLCRDIYFDITVNKGAEPDWKMLKWMKRAGMEEVLDQIKTGEFPEFEDLIADGINPIRRTEAQNQKSWPTTPKGIRGEIIFINRV